MKLPDKLGGLDFMGTKASESKSTANFDYRRDTPPTDWLAKRVEKIRAKNPNPPSHKALGLEFMNDLQEELDALRCQDPCPTQNDAETVTTGTAATSATTTENGSDPAAATAQTCICGLITRISDPSGEWVPKDKFVVVLKPF